jgi:CcmD family protein
VGEVSTAAAQRHGVDVDAMAREFHERETRQFVHSKRAVILAYSAIWVLTVGYLFGLHRRQQRIAREVAELKARVAAGAPPPTS